MAPVAHTPPPVEPETWEATLFRLTGKDVTRCPRCRAAGFLIVEALPAHAEPGDSPLRINENRHAPMKPKSVAFSPDGRFAVIALALNIAPQAGAVSADDMLSVHRFDPARGVIAEAVAEMRGADSPLGNVEICTFLPTISGTPYRILVANQGADVVTPFAFDPEARTLAFTGIFAAGLSFPHGLDACADGRSSRSPRTGTTACTSPG